MVETRKGNGAKTDVLRKASKTPVRKTTETLKKRNKKLRKTSTRKPVCRPLETLSKKNKRRSYRSLPNPQQTAKRFKRDGFIYVILPMLETIRSCVIEMERTARLNEETFAV